MTSYIFDQINAVPDDEKLEYAMSFLRTLLCYDPCDRLYYTTRFGLTEKEAMILNVLVQGAGKVCTRDQIYATCYDYGDDYADIKVIDVFICKIRKKVKPFVTIERVWGKGYAISNADGLKVLKEMKEFHGTQVPIKRMPRLVSEIRPSGFWTETEDQNLINMKSSGSSWWAIAEDLQRSERGCQERYYKLKKRGLVSEAVNV